MTEAFIVDAVRTPVGKRGGGLAEVHPADLGAHVLRAIVDRSDIDPMAVEDVFFGCVDTIGPQAGDIARTCWLAAGLPEEIPGTTIDRQCGSSQQALHFAAQAVKSGTNDVIVAGGVQNMSMIPIASAMTVAEQFGFTDPFSGSEGWRARYGDQEVSQFRGAEMIADKWGITRDDLDAFGAESQRRAVVATEEGRFENEIVGVKELRLDKETGKIVEGTELVLKDEGIRPDTTVETLANLKPAFKPDGKITAGTSSQISDGASAALIMSEEKAKQLGLTPRARFHTFALAGVDPVTMLTGPIPSTAKALEKSGLSVDDIDLFEVNEAFASVVLAWQKELKTDLGKTNVNGGAIALGHPLGCSGTKLLATLLNELERTGGRWAKVLTRSSSIIQRTRPSRSRAATRR
jgi:acetyl-CoA C-acetyltransferase